MRNENIFIRKKVIKKKRRRDQGPFFSNPKRLWRIFAKKRLRVELKNFAGCYPSSLPLDKKFEKNSHDVKQKTTTKKHVKFGHFWRYHSCPKKPDILLPAQNFLQNSSNRAKIYFVEKHSQNGNKKCKTFEIILKWKIVIRILKNNSVFFRPHGMDFYTRVTNFIAKWSSHQDARTDMFWYRIDLIIQKLDMVVCIRVPKNPKNFFAAQIWTWNNGVFGK